MYITRNECDINYFSIAPVYGSNSLTAQSVLLCLVFVIIDCYGRCGTFQTENYTLHFIKWRCAYAIFKRIVWNFVGLLVLFGSYTQFQSKMSTFGGAAAALLFVQVIKDEIAKLISIGFLYSQICSVCLFGHHSRA